MSDTGPSNVPVFSVSDLSQALKRAVEEGFGWVRVRGEISGFKRAASGHLYFAMKDEKSVLDAVCWRGTAGRLSIEPEDGLEVIVSGKLTTYRLTAQKVMKILGSSLPTAQAKADTAELPLSLV